MKLGLAATSLLVLAASGAVAADRLPLIRGIYVLAGTPCEGASNVDTLSYWGDDNGINDQRTHCHIITMAKNGSTYALRRTCTDIRAGATFDDSAEITIRNQTSFIVLDRTNPRAEGRQFRYCGPKVQF